MLDLIYKVLEVQDNVFYIIVTVSIIAAVIQREMLGSDLLAVLAAPTYVAAALITLYLSRENQWLAIGDEQIEAIIASFIGLTISFIIFVISANIFNSITGWSVKRRIKNRNLDGSAKQEKPSLG